MSRTLVGAAALLLTAVSSMTGCGLQPVRSHVILVSIDTLRADHLPAYGYRDVATPAIDTLARDSVRFENAYCQVPLTLPSHAVILTGLLPYQNGVRDNIGFRLSEKVTTLARVFHDAGYATGAAVSSLALRSDRGLAAGFDLYDDRFDPKSPDERPGNETVEKLTKWIETVSGRPIFAMLHLYEPHAPYAPPEPYRSRYASNLYDGEIAAADAAVGRFLAFLKSRHLYEDSIVVFLSDHGEGLNDHGEQEHGVFLYREAIRVPLLFKFPGRRRAGQVVSRPVGLVDLFPTLARLTGIAAPPGLPGFDLFTSLPKNPAPRRLYSETMYPRLALGWSDLSSLIDDRYQYIEAPRPELYDLAADPNERRNLASNNSAAFRAKRLELEQLRRPEAAAQATSEEIRKLGSLGYISVSRGTTASRDLPDPKDKVEVLASYKRLFDLFYAGLDPEVLRLAPQILVEDPGILSVWRILASSRERQGDRQGAVRDLERGISRSPNAAPEELTQTYEQLANLLERAGDEARARRILEDAAKRDLATDAMRLELVRLLSKAGRASDALALLPSYTEAQSAAALDLRGVVMTEAGRATEARRLFERALARDPGNTAVSEHLGMLFLRENDPSAAKQWFEKALAGEPGRATALTGLGLAQAALGEERSAYDSWTRAIAADPRQYDALYNRAILAGRLGRPEEARRGLESFVSSASGVRYAEKLAEARRLLKAMRQHPS